MNTKKKIEQYLHIAPKPLAPDGLLEKLEEDINATKIKTRKSAIRRWFAPTGNSISLRRVAAAAAIAIVVMLPLSYGVTKIIKIYTFKEESRQTNKDGTITFTARMTTISGDFADKEEAKRVLDETRELKKAGKYERTFIKEIERDGEKIRIYRYRYTLSNGRVVEFNERAED